MARRYAWLLIGWASIWTFFVTLLLGGHPGIGLLPAALIGVRLIASAALPGILVQRLTRRWTWPHPMRAAFVAVHLVAAVLFAAAWVLLNSVIESAYRGALVLVTGAGLGPFLMLGVWLYVMIAGGLYAARAVERAGRIEAIAARSQLAALRSQLHPHFLFNALHTVVQLIPRQPRRAAQAAEQIAALLRTTIEEHRDRVPLAEEWTFVERYLDLERIRFGERLRVRVDLTDEARRAYVPSFSLQTLVENAVRHGAAPKVEPTEVSVAGRITGASLTLTVRDTGVGASPEAAASGAGTGLARLRERLAALYGDRARLDLATVPGRGFEATVSLPLAFDEPGEGS